MTSDGIHSIRLLVTTIYTMCKRVPIYTSPRSAFTTTSLRYALYRSLLHIEKNICGTLLMYHSTVVYLILMHYHVLTLPTKKKKESACEKRENFKRRKINVEHYARALQYSLICACCMRPPQGGGGNRYFRQYLENCACAVAHFCA